MFQNYNWQTFEIVDLSVQFSVYHSYWRQILFLTFGLHSLVEDTIIEYVSKKLFLV